MAVLPPALDEEPQPGSRGMGKPKVRKICMHPLSRMAGESNETRRFCVIKDFIDDARYALRQLRASPSFALTCLLSLALGIGATTSVYSVIRGVLLDPYPYRGADRMITFRVTTDVGYNGFSNYLLLNRKELEVIQGSDVLDGVIATDSWDMAATGQELPEAVHTGKLSANALEYFGVPPLVGRVFTKADESQRVVVLSYGYWQRHYAGDQSAVGQKLQLDHENYQIIGVMRPKFAWFHDDVYIPLGGTSDPERIFIVDARLRAGVSKKAAEDSLQPLFGSFASRSPKRFPRGARLKILGINSGVEQRLTGTLTTLFGAVSLMLLIGCANVSILFLARSRSRRHEIAVRAALGASRVRIVRQLLAEALILALAGCAVGVAGLYRALPLILQAMPKESLPNEASVDVNLPVLLFAISAAIVTAVLFGLWPALQSSRVELVEIQASSGRVLGASIGTRRFTGTLLIGQVALTVLLLAAAGASMGTFLRLYRTSLGYDPSHVLTVSLQFPDGTHTQLEERQNFYEQMRQKVAAIPGVRAAAIYPFGFPPRAQFLRQLEIFDQPSLSGQSVYANPVSREFFDTVGIPVREGRIWSEEQTRRASHVVMVNRTFARRYWPGQSALGRRVRMPDFTAFTAWMLAHPRSDDWLEVIGVVGDTPNRGLSEPPGPALYVPYSLVLGDSFNLAIRTRGNPLRYAHAARQAIHTVNASQPVNDVRTAEQMLAEEGWAAERFVTTMFVLFSTLGLALAAIGVYSVVALTTTMRRQEFGIRMAVGAQRLSIARLVLLSGARSVAAGLIVGIALCWAANAVLQRWIKSSLHDPIVLSTVAIVLTLVVFGASCLPAWRGASVDPVRALRES